MKTELAVMFGGKSAEHEISIITALQLMEAVDCRKYTLLPLYFSWDGKIYTGDALFSRAFYRNFHTNRVKPVHFRVGEGFCGVFGRKIRYPVDVFLLAFHGQYGEDGCVQGLLELMGAPYTGGDVLASSACMNKQVTKTLVAAAGIPTLPSSILAREEMGLGIDAVENKVLENLAYPLFVKPNQLGSSVAVSRAENARELFAALAGVFRYDTLALMEPCVESLMEINISVKGGNSPECSVVEVPVASANILSYEDKYLRGGGKNKWDQGSLGLAGLSRAIDPPDLQRRHKNAVRDYALSAYRTLKCLGIVRMDFLMDTWKEKLYFNEVNPLPGSFSYYLWEKSKPRVLYTALIDEMVQEAKERVGKNLCVETKLGFSAL